MNDFPRRVIGAAIGGALGVGAYWLTLREGYALVAAVGAGVALGVANAARTRSNLWGFATAALAVAATILAEAWFRPFVADHSLAFFLAHLTDLPRNFHVSLAIVAILGFYFGRGRGPRAARGGEG
jgi:hypothetical protein